MLSWISPAHVWWLLSWDRINGTRSTLITEKRKPETT